MRAGSLNVAGYKYIPLHLIDLLHLCEISWNVLRQSKPPPGHPAWKDDIDNHQRFLGGRIDKYVSGFMRISMIGQFQCLASNPEYVFVIKCNGWDRAIGVIVTKKQSPGFVLSNDNRVFA